MQERLLLFKPNTAISAFMECMNDFIAHSMKLSRINAEKVITLLSVMAPYMTSELLELIFAKELKDCIWPSYDPALARVDEVSMAIQINGKTRTIITMAVGSLQKDVEQKAQAEVTKWLQEKQITKVIFVADKLINFVVI